MSERAVAAVEPLFMVYSMTALIGLYVYATVAQSVPGVPFDVGAAVVVLMALVLVVAVYKAVEEQL